MSYSIVRGDLTPMPVNITVDDAAVDVSGANTVQLRWQKPDGTITMKTLTEVDALTGSFIMNWTAGDTDDIGVHQGQVVVTTGALIETFPSEGVLYWWVNPQLGDDY